MADIVSKYACEPCRASKLGCDKSRPQCMRCLRKGYPCSYAKQRAPRGSRTSAAYHKPELVIKAKIPPPSPLVLGVSPAADARNAPLVRKRNRVPIACARCRSFKVGCDRQEPCGRCLKADRGPECHYPSDSPSADAPAESKPVIPPYHQTFHSGIHWSFLVGNIENLIKHRRWPSNHHHAEHEQLFSSADNFFGSRTSALNTTRRTLLSYLPPVDIANSLIDSYLNIIEPAHEILHVPTFKTQLEAFWDRPSTADDAWLAQLFAVLALGCQLQHHSTLFGHNLDSTLTSLLFDAARAFLQRTPFMIRPDITSIRTLCLLVIFRQTNGVVCLESAALWPVTGLIVRLAITMGLHLAVPVCGADPGEPPTSTSKLWAAVILLDLRQSLAAGVPVIPPSGDLIAQPLFGAVEFAAGEHNTGDLFFPAMIYDTLPQIYKILELATSAQITLSYTLVSAYDRQIKSLLKHYHRCFSSSSSSPKNRFQWTMINVFFRRVLLALHSRLYQEPDAATRYPVSYWSSLECSLALLSEQRELWETTTPTTSPSQQQSASSSRGAALFFTHVHQQSFFLAALTICFHLVRVGSPLVSPDLHRDEGDRHKCQGQARRTILELLTSCRDIWGLERGGSSCHRSAFHMVDSLLGMLEASESEEGDAHRGSGGVCLGSGGAMGSCLCLAEWD
ncbi:hypothetical protein BJY01DRAFT_223943, partial [Aspergillus pseudoustus]